VEICRRARAQDPADRYPNGGRFAQAVAAWLDGAQRREQAMRVLDHARELKPQAQAVTSEAGGLENQAAEILAMVPPFAPVEAKRDAWAMQDRASQLRSRAEALDAQFVNTVHAALSLSDDLAPAHQMLAEHYKERHALAEAARDETAVVRYETLLEVHDNGQFAVYLKGDGALTLVTDPPGAQATLYRFEPVERRLIPHPAGELGQTPVRAHSLPMGSYLVRLSHPERAPVDYPVYIERELHWDGIRPGDADSFPIYLPWAGELRDGERCIPAGWFWSGGDPKARNGLPGRRLWLDGFVTPRDPVTMGEYLIYLNDLVANGRQEEAAAALPEIPKWESTEESSDREFGFSRDASGRFVFDGGEERYNLPIAWVSWYQAKAYSDWLAAEEKLPWRLMQEMEHEKASRGVDGRYFPWGNHFDATFCAMRDSHPGAGRVMRFTVADFPLDVSPYGVRGCAGNTFAWCEDAYSPVGPEIRNGIPFPPDPAGLRGPGAGGAHRIMRGGSYRDGEAYCRTSFRDCPPAICHYDQIGFRVARSLP
jgi:serine/threonine-protein kinase